jgi:cytochrome P450
MPASDDAELGGRRPEALDSRDALLDPYPWYAEKRDCGVLPYDEKRDMYMALRYDVVKTILADNDRFSAAEQDLAPADTLYNPINKWFVRMDPPEHTRLRRSVEKYFRPDYLEAHFHDRVEELAVELLGDAVAEHGEEFDYVRDYAIRIPTAIIADMIGVPRDQWAEFRRWSQGFIAPSEEYVGGISQEERVEIITEWLTYFQEFLAERKADPRDDMISELIAYEDRDGDPLTDDEIIGICTLLNIAGNITTTSLLSNAMRTFAEAGYIDDLVAGNYEMDTVIEEVLRYRSSLQATERTTTREVDIAGTTLAEGAQIQVFVGAANRDPRQFEDPETFKPERNPRDHIAFGNGMHHCLGAPLARMEAVVSLETFFDRFAAVDVHVEEAVPQLTLTEFGLESLPISVEP